MLNVCINYERIKFGEYVSGIQTDFIIKDEPQNWIVEVDGVRPDQTSSKRLLGKDHIQNKLFESQGFLVVHIDCEQFPLDGPYDAERNRFFTKREK